MSASNRIEALVFDAGGVFTLPLHEPILLAFRELGVEADPDRIDLAHYAGIHGIDTCTGMSWGVYVEAYARALGVPEGLTLTRLRAAFSTPGLWGRRIEASAQALRELASLGLPMAIVSNSDGTVEKRLRELDICQVGPGAGVEVRTVVDSRIVGVEKPEPAIFKLALDVLGVEAHRAVYVGDSIRFDVQGALAAGMRPVLFDPYDHRREAPLEHPRIKSLRDLVELL